MKTRAALIAAIVMIMLAQVALAQEDNRPEIDIPLYPGSEATLEINLTNDDFLPTLQAMLPMFAEKIKPIEGMSAEDLASVFKDVRRVQVLQLDVDKQGVTDTDITTFYTKNIPAGEWTKVMQMSREPVGAMALYVRDMGEYLYGFRVQTVKMEDRSIKRITIAKTEGKVDFVKLMMIAGKLMMPKSSS